MLCGRGFNCHNSDFTAYSNAKLYNQLTAVELQKRLEGSGVDIYVAQPGMSQTNLFVKADHSKWAVYLQVGLRTHLSLPSLSCQITAHCVTYAQEFTGHVMSTSCVH